MDRRSHEGHAKVIANLFSRHGSAMKRGEVEGDLSMKHEATSLYGMPSSSRRRKDIGVMRSLAPNCLASGLSKPFGSMKQTCEITPSPLGICHNILPHNGVVEILITRRCLAVEHVFIQTEANGAQESSSLFRICLTFGPCNPFGRIKQTCNIRTFSFVYVCHNIFLPPRPRLSRPYPLVKTHPNGILRVDLCIKSSLEVPMGTQTLLDEPTPSSLRPQLQRFEPNHIVFVEEHIPHSDELLVDLVRMASQYDTLGYDTRCGWR